jgi:hypothetical protein
MFMNVRSDEHDFERFPAKQSIGLAAGSGHSGECIGRIHAQIVACRTEAS